VADQWQLQVRGSAGEHSEAEGGKYDISNRERMGLTEAEAVGKMWSGVKAMIQVGQPADVATDMEKDLEKEEEEKGHEGDESDNGHHDHEDHDHHHSGHHKHKRHHKHHGHHGHHGHHDDGHDHEHHGHHEEEENKDSDQEKDD